MGVLGRTGGAGFPILFEDAGSKMRIVKRGVERAGATVLFYYAGSNKASEAEVEEWLRRRRSGEKEERVLFLDEHVIRGWEASHLLVVSLDVSGIGLENLVMRAVG